MATIHGLTESEVQARRKQGLGNNITIGPSRSYGDIARANLFTLFNNILFIIGVALIILFLEPPLPFFLGWRKEVSPDKRPAFLALGLFVLFQIIWWVPPLGYYFGILVKPFSVTSLILGVVVIWVFLIRAIWRANLFERFLGLDERQI